MIKFTTSLSCSSFFCGSLLPQRTSEPLGLTLRPLMEPPSYHPASVIITSSKKLTLISFSKTVPPQLHIHSLSPSQHLPSCATVFSKMCSMLFSPLGYVFYGDGRTFWLTLLIRASPDEARYIAGTQ